MKAIGIEAQMEDGNQLQIAKQQFMRQLIMFLNGKVESGVRTEIVKTFLMQHEQWIASLSLDDMNEIAGNMLKQS